MENRKESDLGAGLSNSQNPASNGTDLSETPWFYDMAFRGYWDHWCHVQSWLSAAHYAYGKADKAKSKVIRQWTSGNVNRFPTGAPTGIPCGFPAGFPTSFVPTVPQESTATQATAKEKRKKMRAERRKKQKQKKKKRERKGRRISVEETEEEIEEEDVEAMEAACDDQDEFLNLLAQNHAFRLQRDAYKREDEEKAQRRELLSSRTPVEQAGLKRTREMSDLYGGESILVQTMETNLQMKFDEFSDAHQPPMWPSIPLNLGYGR